MKHLFVSIFFVWICTSCGTQDSVNRNEARIEVEEMAQNLISLWESGDTLKTREIFLAKCTYVDVANDYTFSGIAGVNKYVSHIHNWASDVMMTIRKINASEKMGYVEWTLTAKQTSPIEGRVPIATNKEIMLNGVTLIELKDGKIEKASDYMDVLGFVMQLGSKLELPGGVVIGDQENATQQ